MTEMSHRVLGFIGLGQMGGPMAANIAKGGFELRVFDKAGAQALAPEGAKAVDGAPNLAQTCDTIFMSVPDGPVSVAVAREIAAAPDKRVSLVIDLSTIGVNAAREAGAILSAAGVDYVDAPVSGGQKGAVAGTVTVMWSGSANAMESHRDVLAAFCANPLHVGAEPGLGQALKMLNNFLSATAMAATSEAVLFGLSQGLEMKTILNAVNVSTGQNTASRDKFPEQVLTGKFQAGFKTALLTKDVKLYLENVRKAGTPDRMGERVTEIWSACSEAMPDTDFTEVYNFIKNRKPGGA